MLLRQAAHRYNPEAFWHTPAGHAKRAALESIGLSNMPMPSRQGVSAGVYLVLDISMPMFAITNKRG
jgi:hypothetical protein